MNKRGFLLIVTLININFVQAQKKYLKGAFKQTNANYMIENGLSGKDVNIGVIDAGFTGVNANGIKYNFKRNVNVIEYKNHIKPNKKIKKFNIFSHGSSVTYMIAGKTRSSSGLGINGTFYLHKIINLLKKNSIPEDEQYFLEAIEDLKRSKVKVVNISLGFKKSPKKESQIKEFSHLDSSLYNKLNIIKDDITVIVSAGNMGLKFGMQLPATYDNVITVGSTFKKNSVFRWKMSTVGGKFNGVIKPDVVTYSDIGTSFSAPMVTGIITSMYELDTSLTPIQVKKILHKSSSLYPYPNDYVGYGVPNCEKIYNYILNPDTNLNNSEIHNVKEDYFEIETKSKHIVVFEKENEFSVKRQLKRSHSIGKLKIRRKKGITHTTIALAFDKVIEIVWE